ncbi:MAG: FAD-dependent monooxygenase [Anaerolineae bacterium]|nr:FAD-dependent monooxygenase [Anaerolineae bacterium]
MSKLLDVIIIGAGPTGLTAAIEAVRHGLSVRIVDKNDARSIYSKALVAHARTLEVFHDMGLVDDVLASGQIFTALNIYDQNKSMARIVFEELDWKDTLYPFWLSIPQSDTERCLEEKLNQLGVYVERKTELYDIKQQADFVSVTLKQADGSHETVDASWVIGSDGARSTTRKLVNLHFEGHADDEIFILADVKIESDLPEDEGYNILAADGVVLIVPLPEPQYRRLIFHMPTLRPDQPPDITLEMLQELMDKRTHFSMKLSDIGWTSHFSVKHFVVSKHRQGRVFLAGDAAHIHSPVGGQGMNSGIQDAYNLIWKLALVQHGQAKSILLDSFETERHQVAENLIKRVSMATQIITTNHPISQSLRNRIGNILINTDLVQNQLGRNVAMLNIHYQESPVVSQDVVDDLSIKKVLHTLSRNSNDFHNAPKAGYRAPNVIIQADGETVRESLFDHFHGIHHTLLIFMGQEDAASMKTLSMIAEHVKGQYKAPIRPLIIANKDYIANEQSPSVIVDTNNRIHQTYRAAQSCLYLIRPDTHIAYRNQQLQLDALTKYLDRILI